MAAYFVRSGAGGAGTGADWANAYTTVALAIARPILAGDILWVADDHNESTAGAVSWAFTGTIASPNFVYCVDHNAASPGSGDLLTTGVATFTAAGTLTLTGTLYMYGMNLVMGSGANTANMTGAGNLTADACHFTLGGTSGGRFLNSGLIRWTNCTIKFSAAGETLVTVGQTLWRNSSLDVSTVQPTNFIGNGIGGTIILEGIDFSGMTSKTLVAQQTGTNTGTVVFKDCKFGTSTTITPPLTNSFLIIDVIRSDSANTNYIVSRDTCYGNLSTEITIVRTGGASDGTTPVSRKIVTPSARISWTYPFIMQPIAIWNETLGSRTVTVHATSNIAAGGFPNNDDIWIEVEYEGDGSFPLGSFATNTKANNLATGSAYTSDGTSWASAPTGGTFAMAVPITVQQIGYVYVTVKCARISTTFYVDPLIVLS